MVLKDEPSDANFRVIPIVGMGGIGKTTLARLVYNDKVMEHFKPKAWVCVSDDFDVLRISKAILESINLLSCDLKDLNAVQVQLKQVLAGRKFLLVLDDVWSKNYGLWEALKSPLMAGAPGSKVIVTTRSVDVALTIEPAGYYNLQLLSNDDCWSVFMKHAFGSRDSGLQRNLELIREKVVEKCRGLPLAARTLGGLLRSKQRDDEWQDILSSKIWDLPDESDILPVLRLSYHHLPSHLKRCFAYCAIFPKDYEFEKIELVHLWMAEDLIQQSNINKQLEDVGSEYFCDLLSRSIFQLSSNNSSKFIMHDLVNDLAQWVFGETSIRVEDEFGDVKQLKRFERARHCSYTCGRYDGKNKFKIFHKVEYLRTFLPIHELSDSSYITNMVLSDLLPNLKKLRVLSLKNYYITELSNSIGDLRHLRYLNLSGTEIRYLPESITSLFNLQILMLRYCAHLIKLPSGIGKLIKLRHLDITDANLIKEMPLGVKNLKCLQTLSNFFVGKDILSSCGLKDLNNLKFLRGELCISRLENVTDSHDISEAVLSDKEGLEVLLLEWGSRFNESRDEVVEKNVLDMLRPHKNLKKLMIKCYGGSRFSTWIEDPSFSNIVALRLERCEKCTSLPALGLLSSLKDLSIIAMPRLKIVGSEMYGRGCSKPFQSLETLCLKNLQEWQYWDPIKDNEHVKGHPQLRKLLIVNCPNLSERLPDHLPSLEKLVIRKCAQLVVSFSSFPKLWELDIDGCKKMVCSSLIDSKSLTSVTLFNVLALENWSMPGFQTVNCLKIVSCEDFIPLPQGMHTFTSLRELLIGDCNALTFLPYVMKHNMACLECLQIERCHSLTFIARSQLPSSLKKLEIRNCKKLQYLLTDREDACTSSDMHKESVNTGLSLGYLSICDCSSLLEYLLPEELTHLIVSRCSNLMALPSRGRLPTTLRHLEIWDCSMLTTLSSEGQLPKVLENLRIDNCPKLESIAEMFCKHASLESFHIVKCENLKVLPEGLCNLSCLRAIKIRNCPSLVSFPDGGLSSTNLRVFEISRCKKLEALPQFMHNLNSLQELRIWYCPTITSFPEEGFPTTITLLLISNLNIYKPLIEWGLHKLSSLQELEILGCPDAESFPQEEMEMVLPSSLIRLIIAEFPNLKYLSSKGFQNLNFLEHLRISDCPNLTSFPQAGLPSSLLHLRISGCPLLKKKCMSDKVQEWSKIAHIPRVEIDGKFIFCPYEEE